uniref:C2H2-type domain-containing protein n=1 Tax=Cyclopterus lumpus TaxID=8103 RepID=A0A8C2Z7Q5_CYCLU
MTNRCLEYLHTRRRTTRLSGTFTVGTNRVKIAPRSSRSERFTKADRPAPSHQESDDLPREDAQRGETLFDVASRFSVSADAEQPTAPTPAEEVAPKRQQWKEPEDDDGDALTKELIKTVQQLEDCRAAEESRGPERSPEEDPEHPQEKTSTTLYRCHICNYIFTKKTVLTWHLKTHESKSHDGKGNFDCHICGKRIPCQSNLQNHMRVHTGERPYSCHFCGKCFKLKGHMTEHIRTHTGEKPFSCHVCGKSFNRGSTLRKHVLAKHKEERPYKCGDCEELFTERLLMKKHMRKVHGVKLSTSQSPA